MAKLSDTHALSAPAPSFEVSWHAQVFALTVHLHDQHLFEWTDWAAAFSGTLKRHGVSKELDGGDDYFLAWLETLEELLARTNQAVPSELAEIKSAWETAYLSTPHGQPVNLAYERKGVASDQPC